MLHQPGNVLIVFQNENRLTQTGFPLDRCCLGCGSFHGALTPLSRQEYRNQANFLQKNRECRVTIA
jgi:hypothetical protein